jgi:hypothetical protein
LLADEYNVKLADRLETVPGNLNPGGEPVTYWAVVERDRKRILASLRAAQPIKPENGCMKSTHLMREHLREIAGNERDDFDRAVLCVLDDFEALRTPAQAAGREEIAFYRSMSDAAVYSGPQVANIIDTVLSLGGAGEEWRKP